MTTIISTVAKKITKVVNYKLDVHSRYKIEGKAMIIEGNDNALFFMEKYNSHEYHRNHVSEFRNTKSMSEYLKKKYGVEEVIIRNANFSEYPNVPDKNNHVTYNPHYLARGHKQNNLANASEKPVNLSNNDPRDANRNFDNIIFGNANFSGKNLSRVSMQGASLISANFKQSNLSSTNLKNTDCSNADFTGANFTGVAIENLPTKLTNAQMINVVATDEQKKIFKERGAITTQEELSTLKNSATNHQDEANNKETTAGKEAAEGNWAPFIKRAKDSFLGEVSRAGTFVSEMISQARTFVSEIISKTITLASEQKEIFKKMEVINPKDEVKNKETTTGKEHAEGNWANFEPANSFLKWASRAKTFANEQKEIFKEMGVINPKDEVKNKETTTGKEHTEGNWARSCLKKSPLNRVSTFVRE
jgi:uncharacterized protein YjbI with pentapeptide repeats